MKHVVTDMFTVEVTVKYEHDEDPAKDELMSESDYENMFTHLDEISAGQIRSFDTAKVSKLKHFITEEN